MLERRMNVEQVVKAFGGPGKACEALGMTRQALSLWRKHGIPKLRKFQIEKLTNGKLKA